MLVLAGEVGGRFSLETAHFLRCLASAKVWGVPQILQGRGACTVAQEVEFDVGLHDCSRVCSLTFV